jgi:hypothetical protein
MRRVLLVLPSSRWRAQLTSRERCCTAGEEVSRHRGQGSQRGREGDLTSELGFSFAIAVAVIAGLKLIALMFEWVFT